MGDKRQYIESALQSMIANAYSWYERELNALEKDNEVSPIITLPSSSRNLNFNWNGTEHEIKLVHQFFLDENIMPNVKENSLSNFIAHLCNTTPTFDKIKLSNTKKALWCFFILQYKNKITDKDLFDILPQHCSKIFGNGKEQELKRKNIISELSEMRSAKSSKYPRYINDLIFILKLKS
jgi:hypothetical protein